ncbi:hypothetical protein ACHQM5_024070 [Ranunculus cassubicifolius]
MGCDGIQLPPPLPTLSDKSTDLIISELHYQGLLYQDESQKMSEKELREYAQGRSIILHRYKDYKYVEYYPFTNLNHDVRVKLACHKVYSAIANLTGVDIEFWKPLGTPSLYRRHLCIKGLTRESVDKAIAELDLVKESAIKESPNPFCYPRCKPPSFEDYLFPVKE